ncbi:NhaP-type Na+ H+ and K+ H+ antiporter [Secundilactobacillus similis DSM 23365 = JCM 2765]|uniref:NhaP-type Na+ H+ and K+ H+ antiporter n=1 Tax=Secundilactobacillus similis DSM 23365 = JCM 2765 TaxID=1423804 RepID=A0A0R2F549_9LACO|nr:NhaP-type Na+ H+ and K+ H+ antiporter [Secundilactobacillus similis DSM 23365 = JCM 2765]
MLISNVISHYLTFIPVSLIQVALGLVMALFWEIEIPLDTDWFLLLFIAPLLFNDGRRFPKRELWKLRGPIFANSILLVFLTTIVGGYLIYLLIPRMSLPVSFALAAILSPTDPVAVQSISKRVKLPDRILHLVSGESLINDASGLIAFKYAVAATVTGVFSFGQALGDFVYISLVGLIAGFILMTIIEFLRDVLRRQGINDVVFNTVLQIMAPFVVYVITESVFHASGVIAVVTAGAVSHAQGNRLIEDLPELRLVTEKTWNIIVYLLNGIVFLILGDELPIATTHIIHDAQFNTLQAVAYAFGAWVILLVIRVIWIYVYQVVIKTEHASFRVALLAGLSGVRGAVTMAGVLSLPLVTASGQAFPQRSLALFVAAGVIIISLVAAVITLPLVAPDNPTPLKTRASISDDDDETDDEEVSVADEPETVHRLSEAEARIYIMRLAINAIEEHRHLENQRAAYDLILDYQFIIRRLEMRVRDDEDMQRVMQDEVTLREVALAGEISALKRLLEHQQISHHAYQTAMKQVERTRQRFNQTTDHAIVAAARNWGIWLRHLKNIIVRTIKRQSGQMVENEWQLIDRESAKAAIKALSKYLARDDVDPQQIDRQAIYHLVVFYRNRVERARENQRVPREQYLIQLNRLRVMALGAERAGIQTLLEAGNITWQMAGRLRQYINYSENVLMMTTEE